MKAILVLDMPERCGECQFMDDDCLGGKPDWCPLRPLPEPMEVCGKYPQLGKPMPSYRVGWNACLDKIMGN